LDVALDAVETAGRMADMADALLALQVARARAEGATWEEIAERLGRSRQAVQKRFGVRIPTSDRDPYHPGKGYPTAGALATRDAEMRCTVCGKVKRGNEFPTVRRQQIGHPVREDRCRSCRDRKRR
jgi:hypothetical protein